MITISQAKTQPIEDENSWSYPMEELDYLIENVEEEKHYLFWQGRLYESN